VFEVLKKLGFEITTKKQQAVQIKSSVSSTTLKHTFKQKREAAQ
jgi:hypothetical protein